jgi:hypothetical protein
MPRHSASTAQLPLFVTNPAASPEALARYEAIRPVPKREGSLPQQSRVTGMNYWRLWRDLLISMWSITGSVASRRVDSWG